VLRVLGVLTVLVLGVLRGANSALFWAKGAMAVHLQHHQHS
jgi:hypothetical protein